MLLSNLCPETLIMWQARKISLIQDRHGRCPNSPLRHLLSLSAIRGLFARNKGFFSSVVAKFKYQDLFCKQ